MDLSEEERRRQREMEERQREMEERQEEHVFRDEVQLRIEQSRVQRRMQSEEAMRAAGPAEQTRLEEEYLAKQKRIAEEEEEKRLAKEKRLAEEREARELEARIRDAETAGSQSSSYQKRHDEARLEGGVQGGTFFNAVDQYTKDVEASWATGSGVPAGEGREEIEKELIEQRRMEQQATTQAKEARRQAEERKKAEEEQNHAQEEEEHRNEIGGGLKQLGEAMKKDEYEAALERKKGQVIRDKVDWRIKMSEEQRVAREQMRMAEEALEKARKMEEASKQKEEEEEERKLADERRRKEEKEEQTTKQIMEMLGQQERYEASVNDGMLHSRLTDKPNWRSKRSGAERDETQREEQLLDVLSPARRIKPRRQARKAGKQDQEGEASLNKKADEMWLEEEARVQAEFQEEMKWADEARAIESKRRKSSCIIMWNVPKRFHDNQYRFTPLYYSPLIFVPLNATVFLKQASRPKDISWASELGIITGGDNEDSEDVNASARQVEEVRARAIAKSDIQLEVECERERKDRLMRLHGGYQGAREGNKKG
ncbi:hypothetical protein BJ165DRAFT_1614372 [Panaeolus papilionaceus]|nr:hypothetical protein BJ165DRAFT_1614372 [Panaeolus papilionaceus]